MKKYFLLILIAVIVIGSLFFKSQILVNQGDAFRDSGRVDAAIASYERAKQILPVRFDIDNKIDGAKLILASADDVNGISSFVAELQEQPPVAQIFHESLKQGQIFVPILMYHHIGVNPNPGNPVWAALYVTTADLDAQFRYLANNGYHVVSLEELYNSLTTGSKLPDNPVVLTFDDGYKSFYENAYPLLKKYNFKATVFVITRAVGSLAYLSWDQISEMDKSGLVDFGGHSEHHPSLPSLTASSALEEIKGSKLELESHLGKKVDFFAYPYGNYSQSVITQVRDAGFLAAVTVVYSANQDKGNLFTMPRIMVDGRYGIDIFAKRIQK